MQSSDILLVPYIYLLYKKFFMTATLYEILSNNYFQGNMYSLYVYSYTIICLCKRLYKKKHE